MPNADAVTTTAIAAPQLADYTYQGMTLAAWLAANLTTPGEYLVKLTVGGELVYLTYTKA